MLLEDKKKALQYLRFFKKKPDGTVKGRGCTDGRKQRVYTSKEEDAGVPTLVIESVLLSCVIDAKEGRDVATVYTLVQTCKQTCGQTLVHMKLEGKVAKLLVKIEYSESSFGLKKGCKCCMLNLKRALLCTAPSERPNYCGNCYLQNFRSVGLYTSPLHDIWYAVHLYCGTWMT